LVRGATAKLPVIATMAATDTILAPAVKRSFQERVLLAETQFLKDGNIETMLHAQEVVKFLTTEDEDFEFVFYNEQRVSEEGGLEK
jgi:hypothetical protein